MHECPLTWCAYNCDGYCYPVANTSFNLQERACELPSNIPTWLRNNLIRRNLGSSV